MTYDPRQFPGQYPSPYTAPNPAASPYAPYTPGMDPYAVLKLPAKRAGLLMIFTGCFMLLCGGCVATMISFVIHPPALSGPQAEQFAQQRAQLLAQLSEQHVDPRSGITQGWVMVGLGILFGLMGVSVRGGGRLIMRISLGFAGILTLFVGLGLLKEIFVLLQSGSPGMFVAIIMQAILLAVFIMILVYLVRGLKNQSPMALAQQQQMQQMWQYQQQQQMYAQGYWQPGAGQVPPVQGPQQPATPPAPPVDPNKDEPKG